MLPKSKAIYTCSKCGAQFPRWLGCCSECGAWGTLAAEIVATKPKTVASASAASVLNLENVSGAHETRLVTGLAEFDRVVGGGLVSDSITLLGGEPGIGKSTLVLQIAAALAAPAHHVLYISGEESAHQVKARLERLRLDSQTISFCGATDVEIIIATLRQEKPPLAIIDSIQTLSLTGISSEPGSISQTKACTAKLVEAAKEIGLPLIIIGHVNKDGQVAGPRTLEHLVDAVLYLEGDQYHNFRILRAVKNRFGSTNEIGLFDMRPTGLISVQDPTSIFLGRQPANVPGSAVSCVIKGSRAILIEVQALVSQTSFGYPQRRSEGFNANRLQLLLAVLDKRCGFKFDKQDVHLNIIGGLNIDDPGVDLAVCLALASAARNLPMPEKLVAIGEVGLAGEIRPVAQLDKRLLEAKKFGWRQAIVPTGTDLDDYTPLKITPVSDLAATFQKFLIK